MTAIRLAALVAALVATASLAPAAPQPAEGKNVLQCDGAFARDSSHAKLVQSFGKSSVAFTDIDGAEGEKVKASVIYPDEPRRRVEILWHDEKARARPSTIRVGFKSQWRTVRGLRIGSELAEVEKINGRPFKLVGFDWDLGGRVSDWMGGTLATLPGGCDFRLAFNPWATPPTRPATRSAVTRTSCRPTPTCGPLSRRYPRSSSCIRSKGFHRGGGRGPAGRGSGSPVPRRSLSGTARTVSRGTGIAW